MSFLTESETESIQHLQRNTPYLITGVSHGFFSVARHYGGASYNGSHYTYIPATDELIRDDVIKFVTKARKKAQASE